MTAKNSHGAVKQIIRGVGPKIENTWPVWLFICWLRTALCSHPTEFHFRASSRIRYMAAIGNWITRDVCQTTGQTRGWISMTADSVRCPRHLLPVVSLSPARSIRTRITIEQLFKAWLWSADSLDKSTNFRTRLIGNVSYFGLGLERLILFGGFILNIEFDRY